MLQINDEESQILKLDFHLTKDYGTKIKNLYKNVWIQSYKILMCFIEFSPMNSTRDNEILKKFGKKLKNIRNSKKVSIRKLADEADVDFSQIHRIEKGESNPTLTMMLALANALQIDAKTLLDFEDESTSSSLP